MKNKLFIALTLCFFSAYLNAQEIADKSGFTFKRSSGSSSSETIVNSGAGNISGFSFQESDFSEVTLMKEFKGESIETTKKFSVGAGYNVLKLELNGMVENGTITITIIKPNGTKMKSIEIDADTNVHYSQRFDLKKNPTELTGDWQIKIQTDKAKGFYRFIINTR